MSVNSTADINQLRSIKYIQYIYIWKNHSWIKSLDHCVMCLVSAKQLVKFWYTKWFLGDVYLKVVTESTPVQLSCFIKPDMSGFLFSIIKTSITDMLNELLKIWQDWQSSSVMMIYKSAYLLAHASCISTQSADSNWESRASGNLLNLSLVSMSKARHLSSIYIGKQPAPSCWPLSLKSHC